MNTAKAAWRLIETAKRMVEKHNAALRAAGQVPDWSLCTRIEEIQVYCADQLSDDFDAQCVVTGNWNNVDMYDRATEKRVVVSDLPSRLCKALERIGVDIAWSDQTSTCDDCGKLLQTEPDCYSWQPSFVIMNDCELVCEDCLDPESYLESIEGDPNSSNRVESIDPGDHGYFLFESDFEAGWHPGQDASPSKIAKALEGRGVKRFLFQVDEVSQFYSKFSVYIHDSELERGAVAPFEDCETQEPSNSARLDRMLRSIP